jgi:hypothetical protein
MTVIEREERLGCCRISVRRNASQFAGACGESLFRKRIKPSDARIPFNGGVKLPCVEGLEPCTKPRQLARGKLFDGFLDVFGCGHASDIALVRCMEKGAEDGVCEDRKPVGWVELLAKPITWGIAIDGYRFAQPILRAGRKLIQPVYYAPDNHFGGLSRITCVLGAKIRYTGGILLEHSAGMYPLSGLNQAICSTSRRWT